MKHGTPACRPATNRRGQSSDAQCGNHVWAERPVWRKKKPALKLPTVLTNLGEEGLNPSCFCCLRLLLKASGADGGEAEEEREEHQGAESPALPVKRRRWSADVCRQKIRNLQQLLGDQICVSARMTSYNAPGRQTHGDQIYHPGGGGGGRKAGFSFGSKLEPSRAVEQHASRPKEKKEQTSIIIIRRRIFVVLTRYKNVTRKVITAYVKKRSSNCPSLPPTKYEASQLLSQWSQ